MAEEERATRDMETRETEKRDEPWKPAPLLPEPSPREGLDHRYVRASSRGESDNINVSQALRDGWEPVNAADYPELRVISDRGSQYPGNVLIGGLLLCARPTEIGDKYKELAGKEVRDQVEGVDRSYFREQDSRMPMMSDKKSRVTFGDN
jgi:hypothetical protein